MLQESFAKTVRIDFSSNPAIDIVVQLDISNTILLHQSIDDSIRMRNNLRITKIQLVSAVINNPFPMPAKKPVIRYLVCQGTFNAHYLDLKPKPGNHPF